MRFFGVCVGLLLSMAVTVARADIITPSHACSQPYKPYEFSSRDELVRFIDEVEEYKKCIADFINEQNEAIQKHQEAKANAIQEWNDFAGSLK